MTPDYQDDDVEVYVGDCLNVLRELPDRSIDAVCTDPPYAIEFMGREWDSFGRQRRAYQEWCESWARECLRVLKPGGHLLAFGGTRTYHRLACAIEDAGFEVRDSIDWIYGSGFPKSLDVGKAVDRQLGAEREVVGRRTDGRYAHGFTDAAKKALGTAVAAESETGFSGEMGVITKPATEQGARWDGWGTALKPAHEPIVVGRKPLAGTVAANAIEHGVGPLNIDGCRVAHADEADLATSIAKNPGRADVVTSGTYGANRPQQSVNTAGRWPANVVLSHSADCEPRGTRRVATTTHFPAARPGGGLGNDGHVGQEGLVERLPGTEVVEAWDCAPGCPVRELDSQSGVTTAGAAGRKGSSGFVAGYDGDYTVPYGDTGGASRYFPTFRYEPKAAPLERPTADGVMHPTVKPVALMQWLVRLVVPRGATVLDPFLGSGTTAEACVIEGMRCVGVEREPSYLPLIQARLRKAITPTLGLDL